MRGREGITQAPESQVAKALRVAETTACAYGYKIRFRVSLLSAGKSMMCYLGLEMPFL